MTIAVLSWGARKTLRNTLNSYKSLGLNELDDERIIFFQEITDEDRKIAGEYGYQAEGSPINVGIANGYKSLVAHATGDLFLFLENDWELIENPRILFDAGERLRNLVVDVVKLRHRTNPGAPLWSRIYEGNELSDRGQRFLLDSLHWSQDPRTFLGLIDKQEEWYITTSQFANWTNNPTMFRTEWLREQIIPRMGTIDVEIDIQPWWEQQKFIVAQHEVGLFTHSRLDR